MELNGKTGETLRSPTVTPTLQRLAAQAASDPKRVFTTLAYLIDEDFLHEAYRQTSKSSAPGIDGVTAHIYAEHLDANLRDLYARLWSGRYQAAPVERGWIEKDDGGRARLVSQRSRTRLSSERWRCCWKRSTSKTFRTARMAFGQAGARIMHSTSYASGACRRASAGSWMQM